MRKPSWDLNKAIESFGFKPIELSKDALYEAGKTYWCNYWSKWYKVIDVIYDRTYKYPSLRSVTIEWQDGKVASHCTSLDTQRDWELIWQ